MRRTAPIEEPEFVEFMPGAPSRAPRLADARPIPPLAPTIGPTVRAKAAGAAHVRAMISRRNATCRSKAARPAGLALTVVRGRRATKALATST